MRRTACTRYPVRTPNRVFRKHYRAVERKAQYYKHRHGRVLILYWRGVGGETAAVQEYRDETMTPRLGQIVFRDILYIILY